MAENRAYHHGDLKNALLTAALEQIEAEGAATLNLRKLARTVGVTHAAAYRHFADKRALVSAIAQHGFEGLSEALEAAASDDPPLTRLYALARGYIRFALSHPEQVKVMFSVEADRDHDEVLYWVSKRAFLPLKGAVEAAQREGTVREQDASELAAIIWSLLHGFATLLIERQLDWLVSDEAQADTLTERGIRALLEGVKPVAGDSS